MLIRFGCIICTFDLLGNETLNMYFMCLRRFYLAASLKNINIVRIKQPNKKSNSPTERLNRYKRNVWVAWSRWTMQRDKAVEKSMCQRTDSQKHLLQLSQVLQGLKKQKGGLWWWGQCWGRGDCPPHRSKPLFPGVLPQESPVSPSGAQWWETGSTPSERWL